MIYIVFIFSSSQNVNQQINKIYTYEVCDSSTVGESSSAILHKICTVGRVICLSNRGEEIVVAAVEQGVPENVQRRCTRICTADHKREEMKGDDEEDNINVE